MSTDWSRTIAYIFASGMAVIVAYYAGNLIGFINGHHRGRTADRRLAYHEPQMGWGYHDGWH